jgi:Salmonella virulence plasmid 65kDa B protein
MEQVLALETDLVTLASQLSYDSSSGNGSLGFGWSLGIPAITCKTNKSLPLYCNGDESDVFILVGVEDLVPVLDPARGRKARLRTVNGTDFRQPDSRRESPPSGFHLIYDSSVAALRVRPNDLICAQPLPESAVAAAVQIGGHSELRRASADYRASSSRAAVSCRLSWRDAGGEAACVSAAA